MKFVLLAVVLGSPLYGVTVTRLTETAILEKLDEEEVWAVSMRPGTTSASFDELAIDSNFTAPQTRNYDDFLLPFVDFADIFNPAETLTPFSLTYTANSELVFSVGPTIGKTTVETITVGGVDQTGEIALVLNSTGIDPTTHIRFVDLFLNTQPILEEVDVWGQLTLTGSSPNDGLLLSGIDTAEPWILFGKLEVDYEGNPDFPALNDFTGFILGFEGESIPEPSSLTLFLAVSLGVLKRRR